MSGKTVVWDFNSVRREKSSGLASIIDPPKQNVVTEVFDSHTSEPIKSVEDIEKICKYFLESKNYRDYMLFICGINFGLRASDLRQLTFSTLITDDFKFRETFPVFEIKTRNTRKKMKNRYITINKAVEQAVTLYLENTENVSLSDYMFRSLSNNGSSINTPITVRSMERILKKAAKELSIDIKISTHTMRKTFGFHQMRLGNNDHRRLLLLQKMFNHSSSAQTLDYIGITGDEIIDAYKELNLGYNNSSFIMNSQISEEA